jgi:signal transduction histidine kinase
VGFRTDIPDELIEIPLGSSMRYNIFLSVRELVHNAVKHGRPTLVYLRVRCVNGELHVEVEDNGSGFDPATVHEGRGLANVRERMQQMGGTMEIVPLIGAGSLVVLRLKMNARMPGGRAV